MQITGKNYEEKHKVLNALYEVADPELGINIVDLGLVYNVEIEDQKQTILIEMTLSTRSCPLGGIITGHAKAAAEGALEGYEATVNLVWEPKWSSDKISEQGKAELGW